MRFLCLFALLLLPSVTSAQAGDPADEFASFDRFLAEFRENYSGILWMGCEFHENYSGILWSTREFHEHYNSPSLPSVIAAPSGQF